MAHARRPVGKQVSGRAHKVVEGIKYYPCLYAGRIIGHEQYMAAIDENGELLIDERNGKPVPYRYAGMYKK